MTKMMKIGEKLASLKEQPNALLAVNFYNYETLKGVILAASSLEQPVILQLTQSSIDYMGVQSAVAMARSLSESYGVQSYIHLDHGGNIELVKKCLDEGFDSVMIDGSEMPFDENVEITRKVVELAKPYGAAVEAELGYIAKLGQKSDSLAGFTTPEEASEFVKKTGVDSLAIAIGSAHGFYKQTPRLQIDLLKTINKSVKVPLVLHGSSGIPDEQIKEAIANGICKVNIATEVKDTFMRTLKTILNSSDEIDLRRVFPGAIDSVSELLSHKLKVVSLNA